MTDLINLGMHNRKQLKDQVTPHKMALLVLIQEYCAARERIKDQIIVDVNNVYTEKEEREFMFSLLQLLQSADLELKELIQKLQDVAKPKLMSVFLERLKELLVQGVKATMDLFQSLPDMLFLDTVPRLHKSSVLGLFVRRMVLASDKLSFSQLTKLYSKYKVFYESWAKTQQNQPTGGAWDNDNSNMGDTSLSLADFGAEDDKADLQTSMLNISMTDVGRYSQRQAEFFIAQQAHLLQHNELEALAPKKLQQKIQELLASNSDLAEAHYLSYLNNLRVKEYCGTLDSLYHYFDRQTNLNVNPSTSGNRPNKTEEDTSSREFRYAALNMAAVQYRFGHREMALAAVQEAISLAQEVNDNICLQHALGWLQRLGVQGTSNSAYLLDRLVTKSGELNLPYLTSLGVQAFAKHNALATATPSSVFEFLLKSDILNCQHSQSDLMCVSYAQKGALWQLYGRREMCSLNSQLMLNLNTSHLGVYHNGEAECLSLCHLAKQHAQQGDMNKAFIVLENAKTRFPADSQHCHIWMLYEQQLLFERALHHGKWATAEQAVLSMSAINEREASFCRVQLLKDQDQVTKAMELLQTLLQQCSKPTQDDQAVSEFTTRLLLLQGELYCSTGNPTEAGQPLLAALTLAKEHHYSYMVAMATLQLAYVQFCLGMPQQALSLIDEVFLTVLTHGGVYDRARAQFLCAKCQVAAASRDGPASKKSAMLSAVQMLHNVINWFKKMEAHYKTKDAVYYQARLYHELGYTSERNKCALEFRQLDQQYPTLSKTTVLAL